MSDKNSAKELRAMSAKELSALVRSLREELFNLRLQQATGQLEKPSRVKEVRRTIARVKTEQTGRSRSAAK